MPRATSHKSAKTQERMGKAYQRLALPVLAHVSQEVHHRVCGGIHCGGNHRKHVLLQKSAHIQRITVYVLIVLQYQAIEALCDNVTLVKTDASSFANTTRRF